MKKNNCKRWISLILAAVLCLTNLPGLSLDVHAASDDFAGGSGTAEDPYLIETANHLNNVRNDLSAHYKMVADIEFAETDFAEDGDFYNNGAGWQPIGSKDTPFSGSFDGNGYTITGLKINDSSNGKIYLGLIGYQNGGEIKDLGMVDSEINSSATSAYISKPMSGVYADVYTGGIVGYASGSTITGCYNTGSITVEASASGSSSSGSSYDTYARNYVGGIVGYASGTAISNCYNAGTITADKTSSSSRNYCYAYSYAGGIVGDTSDTTITGCYNIGNIAAKTLVGEFDANAYPYARGYAGGISGDGGTITDCYNGGSVSAVSESSVVSSSGIPYIYVCAGGISGIGDTIADCHNTGNVTAAVPSSIGKAHRNGSAGGISGAGGTITNCYNTGNVTTTSKEYAIAGGITGSSGNVVNCYNTGSVRAEAQTSMYPGNAYAYAGGITGKDGTAVTESYNTGSVAAEATAINSGRSAEAYAYAGGIAGYVYGKTISILDSYNAGSVTGNASATADNISNLYVSRASVYSGGMIGYGADATITNCYNMGSIEGSSAAKSPYGCYAYENVYLGGIAGFASTNTSIADCYYLNAVHKGVGYGTNAGSACTTAQMKQQSTFTGFDFSSVWTMDNDGDYLLPRLQGMSMVQIHRYTSYISNNDATCTTDGTKTAICDYCNETDTAPDEGSATGHDYTDATCTTPKTCKICGEADGAALGHSWIDATYDAPRTCGICGITDGTPLLKPAPEKPHKIVNVVSGVHVYWNASEGVEKYGLWRSETGKDGTYTWIGNPAVSHFTDTKVESGKTYYYKVTVLDTKANTHSEKSEAIGITYVATPDITLRVNRAVGIGLRWDRIEGATGYAIYRKNYYSTDAWVRVATIQGGDCLSWDDSSVKNSNGEVYKYTIRALAGSDMNTLSGCRNTGRTMVRLTSRSLHSAEAAGATSIKVSWGTTSQATGYEVRFMVGSTVYKTYTIGNYRTGVKTFTGFESGQTYKIQVRSYKKVDGVGSFYSAWSTAKNVTLR